MPKIDDDKSRLERIADLFDAERNCDGWRACCPAHDDNTPSLSINEGKDGRILIHCHAGCETKEVLEKVGLSMRDLAPNPVPPIVATYDYYDETGTLLSQVCRTSTALEPKGFHQRRPDGNDGWLYTGVKDVRKVLYRLPELIESKADKAIVFFVEGEKDADRLAKVGLVATTNVGGAGKWKAEYAEALRNRRVCLLPDNDKPGRDHMAKVAATLQGKAKAVTVTLPVPDKGDVSNWLDAGHTADELVAIAKEAFERPQAESAAAVVNEPERIQIALGDDEYRVNEEAEAVLAAKAEGLYQRGGSLVHVIEHGRQVRPRIKRPDEAPVVRQLKQPILREMLTRCVECVQRTSKGDKVVSLPGHVVAAIHARGVWKDFAILEGVVSHPVMLPDGAILAKPGYNRDSGLLLWLPDGLEVNVPGRPSRHDASKARDVLMDVVCDFPFKSGPHRAAWLASLLTPLARHAFEGPAPLAHVDGNVAGVGKGLLVNVVFAVVTGREASVMGYTNDREELRKAITTLAVDGDEMVTLDNLSGAFGSAVLDRALTTTWWKDRILGGNTKYDGPLTVTWYSTGNNIEVVGDTPRRIMHIRLESPLENPDQRSGFKYPNLLAHVQANRGRLLGAALTILRAYVVAGKSDMKLMPWGSFDGWSALVRSAVVWVGMEDPGKTREEMRRQSCPERQAQAALFAGIKYLDPNGHGLTVATILERLEHPENDDALMATKDGLLTLCPGKESGKKDGYARSVGLKLRSLRGRVVGGLVLEQIPDSRSGVRWRVVE